MTPLPFLAAGAVALTGLFGCNPDGSVHEGVHYVIPFGDPVPNLVPSDRLDVAYPVDLPFDVIALDCSAGAGTLVQTVPDPVDEAGQAPEWRCIELQNW